MATGVQALFPDPADEIVRLPIERFDECLPKLLIADPRLPGKHREPFCLE